MIRTVLIILLYMAGLAAQALDVDATAGRLGEILGASAAETESLTVRGEIDYADLAFIAGEMPRLTSLNLGKCRISGATISTGTFAGSGIRAIVLPDMPLSIGDMAFASSALETIEIPQGSTIGQGTFAACHKLRSAKLHGADISSGYIFNDCPELQAVDLGACAEIGAGTFMACRSLQKIIFPSNLKAIGYGSFTGSGLKSADLKGCTGIKIGAWSFAGTPISTLTLPSGCELGEGAFSGCSSLTSISGLSGISGLPDFAFNNAGNPSKELAIPEGVTLIGKFSLKGLGATEVRLPSTLDSIGRNAMEGMTGLSKVDALALNHVPSLGNNVWEGVVQDAVRLEVAEEMEEAFSNAGQWQDFEIRISGLNPPAAGYSGVRGRITGQELIVESTDTEISILELYAPDGIRLARIPVRASTARADLSQFSTRIFIARVLLADGIAATIKFAR